MKKPTIAAVSGYAVSVFFVSLYFFSETSSKIIHFVYSSSEVVVSWR